MIILRRPGGHNHSILTLTDTPTDYDVSKFLRSTASGTVWSTISGGVGTHSELTNLDYLSSGHTGFQPFGDYLTTTEFTISSGTLQDQIDGKSDIGHTHLTTTGTNQFIELTDTPTTYSGNRGKFARVNSSGDALEFINLNITDGLTQDGVVHVINGSNYVDVIFQQDFVATDYSLSLGLQNTVDGAPSIYPAVITSKTISGFSVEFSGDTDTNNYYLNWIATISGGGYPNRTAGTWQSGNETLVSGTNTVDVVFPSSFEEGCVLIYGLQNTINSNASIYPAIITGKSLTGFSLEFSGHLDYDGYVLNWTATTSGSVCSSSAGLTEIVNDTSPELGGNLEVGSNCIVLDTTPSGNFVHGYTTGYSSADVSYMYVDRNDNGVGTPLYMKPNGRWHQCTAASGTTQMPCFAITVEEGEGMRNIMWKGILRKGSWSWTAGDLLYVSTVEGALTSVEPSMSSWSQCIGIAISSDTIRFDPSFYKGYINS